MRRSVTAITWFMLHAGSLNISWMLNANTVEMFVPIAYDCIAQFASLLTF
jgi:hypothetical protein